MNYDINHQKQVEAADSSRALFLHLENFHRLLPGTGRKTQGRVLIGGDERIGSWVIDVIATCFGEGEINAGPA